VDCRGDTRGAQGDRGVRVWKDATGKFSIEAKLSGLAGGVVKLKRADGSVISVPVEKLSEADRTYLDELKK
jgi:hypothetical protein